MQQQFRESTVVTECYDTSINADGGNADPTGTVLPHATLNKSSFITSPAVNFSIA
jgi:hypothetical protein